MQVVWRLPSQCILNSKTPVNHSLRKLYPFCLEDPVFFCHYCCVTLTTFWMSARDQIGWKHKGIAFKLFFPTRRGIIFLTIQIARKVIAKLNTKKKQFHLELFTQQAGCINHARQAHSSFANLTDYPTKQQFSVIILFFFIFWSLCL